MAQAILAAQDHNLAETRALRQRVDEVVAADANRRRFADSLVGVDYQLRKRELAAAKRADEAAAEAAAARQREASRINAEVCDRIRFAYADAFAEHNAEPPLPLDGEGYNHYRNRCLQAHIDRLPDEHEFARVRADSFAPAARNEVEKIVLSDSIREARAPTGSNLPQTVHDPRSARHVIDHKTGVRETKYFARESFIKALSRAGGRVVRLSDPTRGIVLMGRPWPVKAA
jgi:hypothetical protein